MLRFIKSFFKSPRYEPSEPAAPYKIETPPAPTVVAVADSSAAVVAIEEYKAKEKPAKQPRAKKPAAKKSAAKPAAIKPAAKPKAPRKPKAEK